MIDVLFLGTGGGMPMTYRRLSSVLLSYGGRKILLDCGEGTQVGMREYHTGFRDLDWIFITHIHGDHIFGLPGLLATMGNSERTEPVTVVGPKGVKEAVEGLCFTLKQLPFKLRIMEDPKEFSLTVKDEMLIESESGELIIKTFPFRHRIPCFAYSFELSRKPKFDVNRAKLLPIPITFWKKLQNGETVLYEGREYYPSQVLGEERNGLKLSFLGDTVYFPEISDFVKNSDLLISEGSYGDDNDLMKAKKNKHMTFRGAALIAENAKVKRLILTHFSPSMMKPSDFKKNATEVFSNVKIAKDGYSETVKFDKE